MGYKFETVRPPKSRPAYALPIVLAMATVAFISLTPRTASGHVVDTNDPPQKCPTNTCIPCMGKSIFKGVAQWWVSEPAVNLRIEDEPSSYDPSHGPRVSFSVSYRQRGAIVEDPAIFGVGPGWSCSFRAFVLQLTGDPANVFRVHRGGAG